MTTLTDKLLAYSRIGSTAIKKETVDVDAIVDEVIEDLSSIRSNGVEIRRVGKFGVAEGDATRIG